MKGTACLQKVWGCLFPAWLEEAMLTLKLPPSIIIKIHRLIIHKPVKNQTNQKNPNNKNQHQTPTLLYCIYCIRNRQDGIEKRQHGKKISVSLPSGRAVLSACLSKLPTSVADEKYLWNLALGISSGYLGYQNITSTKSVWARSGSVVQILITCLISRRTTDMIRHLIPHKVFWHEVHLAKQLQCIWTYK